VSLRNALIIAQVCISFVLLIMAGLTLRSFAKLESVNAGFDAENVVSLGLPWNFSKYADAAALGKFEERVLDRLRELPGVTSAASISGLPLNNATPFPQPITIENHQQDPNAPKPEVDVTAISENAFQSLGIPLLQGRDFNRSDTTEKPGVAIVSAATAHRYWGNEEAVGRRISVDQGQHWLTVVGVSGDVKFFGLDRDALDEVYIYSGQNPGTGNFVVRTTLDAQTMGDAITRAVHVIDPEQPVTDVQTLTEIRENSLINTRVTSILLSAFAGLALVLAATGLFAVISFLVGQRTREIGIRIALGARTSSVLMMVMGEGIRMALIGLCLGVGGALLGSGMVKTLLYGVSTTDWITFCAVGLVLIGTALLASYVPARRASQVDPMVALRYE
jgi:predicted permease